MIRIWPFPNITPEEAGPQDADFNYQDAYHNKFHVWRVMFWALNISRMNAGHHVTGNLGACVCAAFLHDLARRGGGECHQHGQWAWDEKAEKYLPHFQRFGVTPGQYKWIRRAVRLHCVPFPEYASFLDLHEKLHEEKFDLAVGHPHPETQVTEEEMDILGETNTAQVLRDADALDLFRIPGREETFDPRFLTLPRARSSIGFAKELISRTEANIDNMKSFADVWEIGKAITGHSTYEETIPTEIAGESACKRRLRQSRQYWAMGWPKRKLIHETLYGKTIEDVVPIHQRAILRHADEALRLPPEELRKTIEDQFEYLGLRNLRGLTADIAEMVKFIRPVTYISHEAFDLFKKEGNWKSFWEIWEEKTLAEHRNKGLYHEVTSWGQWHFRYTDEPDLVRESHEFRLYGEKGRQVIHGVLLALDTETGMPLPESIKCNDRLSDFYGKIRIEWKDSVLEESTFTVNDSHTSIGAFPATPTYLHNIMQIVVTWKALRGMGGEQIRPFFKISDKLNLDDAIQHLCHNIYQFLELQIHRPVTMDDIARISEARTISEELTTFSTK